MKTYNELIQLSTFDERLQYLRLYGTVGADIFGFDRQFNQKFYSSKEWRDVREYVFYRDRGCDLGIEGYDILAARARIIHHIEPMTLEDIQQGSSKLLDPNNLITTTAWTHKIIHYGIGEQVKVVTERLPNDTCPWRT